MYYSRHLQPQPRTRHGHGRMAPIPTRSMPPFYRSIPRSRKPRRNPQTTTSGKGMKSKTAWAGQGQPNLRKTADGKRQTAQTRSDTPFVRYQWYVIMLHRAIFDFLLGLACFLLELMDYIFRPIVVPSRADWASLCVGVGPHFNAERTEATYTPEHLWVPQQSRFCSYILSIYYNFLT
jgi:hypothetical protein